jgi:hypothetical protein
VQHVGERQVVILGHLLEAGADPLRYPEPHVDGSVLLVASSGSGHAGCTAA